MTLGTALDQQKSRPPAKFCAVEDFWFTPVIRARIALGRQSAWAMGTSVAWVRAGQEL
jgi:hypothetical protein